jgi:ion channel POLLUX/CASTOR
VRTSPRRTRPSLIDRLRYRLDTAFSRGNIVVILWLAAVVGAVIVAAAAVVTLLNVTFGGARKEGLFESAWQSLVRVLDTGTIASDYGWQTRIVALVITLAGILIASSLIGLVATGIDRKINDLRKGRSRVIEEQHTLILGWSPRLFGVIRQLVVAGQGGGRGCVVVLADRDKVEMEDEIRARAGATGKTRVRCRTGDPASPADLELVNAFAAKSIVVLGGADDGDAEAVKAVLAVMADDPELERAYVVAELSDEHNAQTLRDASNGRVLAVRSAYVIASVTAQACRQSGLAAVFQELLDFEGDELHFARLPELDGRPFGVALDALDDSTLLGIRHGDGSIVLNPPMDTVLTGDDTVIALSENDDTVRCNGSGVATPAPPPPVDAVPQREPEQLLVIGWNPLGAQIMEGLDQFLAPGSTVEVLVDDALVPATEHVVDPALSNLAVSFHATQGDPHVVSQRARAQRYQHIILLGYRTGISSANADARTLLSLLQLHRCLHEVGARASTRIVAELLDPADVELGRVTAADDLIVSDELASLMMAQLAERPELGVVFDDLFDANRAVISLKPVEWYLPPGTVVFAACVDAARRRGEVAVGYRHASGTGGLGISGVHLNPSKASEIELGSDDQLVVLSRPA